MITINVNDMSTIVKCPVCDSENIEDASIYKQREVILGPGHPGSRPAKLLDTACCLNCGVYFKVMPEFQIKNNNK